MKAKYLTPREYEIMKILWSSDTPMLISDITKMIEVTAKNSVHPMLNSLIEKGFVKIAGNILVVKTFSRLYAPAISAEEYTANQVNEIFKTKKNWFNLRKFLLRLSVQNKNKNAELIQSIQHFIEMCEEKADNNGDD